MTAKTKKNQTERAAAKQMRELERRAKEQAKLSEMEQAALEVCTFEAKLELLLSVHKEEGPTWDWERACASLPPPIPQRRHSAELVARQQSCLLAPAQRASADQAISEASSCDERDFQMALELHAKLLAELQETKALATRILSGDLKAYTQAIAELSPLSELSSLGSTIRFSVHNESLVECVLKVHGSDVIPKEVKSLTSTGKFSVKPMPRVRFQEIFQDHICSCMLRVAREIFALLPVSTIIITALVDLDTLGSANRIESPVLSAAIPRNAMLGLNFGTLDPSDTIERFRHRGDFRASRRSGAFAPIAPITPDDLQIPSDRSQIVPSTDLLEQVQQARRELGLAAANISTQELKPVG